MKGFYNLKQLLQQDHDKEMEAIYEELRSSQIEMKNKSSSLSFQIDAAKKQINIHSNFVKKCNINFYKMNTELLFSINPFTFNDKDVNEN